MESNAATTRGYSPIEGGAQEQTAYFKFPVAKLKTGETIKSAVMKFEKKGGPQADCLVSTTPCDYDSKSLTYKNKPTGIDLISQSGVFPAANGPVTVKLDVNAVTRYLNKEKTAQLCVVVSGGLAQQQDLMDNVQVSMSIHRKASTPKSFQSDPNQQAVSVPRRRRSAANALRRRRSVQAIKDQAAKIKADEEKAITKRLAEESKQKLPAMISAKKMAIANSLRKEQVSLVKEEVKARLASEFSKDKVAAKSAELRKVKVEKTLKATLPAKFAQESVALKNRMRAKITSDMTAAEEKLIELEAKTMADTTVAKEQDALLAGAIKKKADADYPKLLKSEIEQRAPKDFKAAIDALVVKSVAEKTKQAVDKAVQAKINTELKLQEQGVATKAATKAVNNRLNELVQQEVTKYIQKEKSKNTPIGMALSKNRNSHDFKTALTRVKNIVAGKPSPLSAEEKDSVEKLAADQAVAKLKAKITAESNDQIRTKEFVDNVVRDLKKSETERLTPIVKKDVLASLEKELEPNAKKRTEVLAKKYVNAEKKKVLTILHAALVQKNKLALMPKMNRKLEKTVPAAIQSPKFAAQVQAALLELKAKMEASMRKALDEPLKQVAEMEMQQEEKEREQEITTKVKLASDKKVEKQITEATKSSKVYPLVERQQTKVLDRKVKLKVGERVKEFVNKNLATDLREALKAKYGKGTMKDAINTVKMNQEPEIRSEIEGKMKVKSEKLAGAKIVAAKLALKKTLVKSLTETFYQKFKKDGASKFEFESRNMSVLDKKAAQVGQEKSYKLRAADAAEKQAEVELAGEKGEQLEKRIKLEELNKAKQGLDQEVEQQVTAKAQQLSDKALGNLYTDDLEAMQQGSAHAGPAKGADPSAKEDPSAGPNVAKAAEEEAAKKNPIVQQMAAAAGAIPEEQKPSGNATALAGNATAVTKPAAAPAKVETTKPAAAKEAETTKPAAAKEAETTKPAAAKKEAETTKPAAAKKEAETAKPAAVKKEAEAAKPAAAKEAEAAKPAAAKEGDAKAAAAAPKPKEEDSEVEVLLA